MGTRPARSRDSGVSLADERRGSRSDFQHAARKDVGGGDPPSGRRPGHVADVPRPACALDFGADRESIVDMTATSLRVAFALLALAALAALLCLPAAALEAAEPP